MRIALLIVFSYEDSQVSDIRWKLPGVEIDLFQSYLFVKNMNADIILVITDISNNFHVSPLTSTIAKGIVNVEILNTIDKIKKDGNYWYYTHKKAMIRKITQFIQNATELFIYYTGHGVNNKFVLPKIYKEFTYQDEVLNDDLYSADKFMQNILSNIKTPVAQIFMILDCCQLSTMKLSYRMDSNGYISNEKYIYTPHYVLCFTSSLLDENSIIVNHGSVFSRSIFKILRSIDEDNIYTSNYRSIMNIYRELNKYSVKINNHVSKLNFINFPSSNLYSSSASIKMVWSWIFGHTDYYKIEIDHITSSIQITIL